MGASMILFLLLMLLVQQCFAVSCRTCEGQECLKKNVNYRMCTKLSSIVPPEAYLILPQIKENVQYGCLKLEYPYGELGSLFVVEKCIIMQDIHSVCQDIAKRIPYTTCFVQLPSDSAVISNNNYANQHEIEELVTNKIFGSSTSLSTEETEEEFRAFGTQKFEADMSSNTDEDSVPLGVTSSVEFSSEYINAHRNDDEEHIPQASHDLDDVSTLMAITNVPIEESERELNSFETKEPYGATDGYSSEIEASTGGDITTPKPSIVSTESCDNYANELATTLKIFNVDNHSNDFDKQSISTSITNLPADNAEIESWSGDVTLIVQPSDESLNSNNNYGNELSTQDNYELINQSNGVEEQSSSVTLGGTEKELIHFESDGAVATKEIEDAEHSTTVGSISSIELSDESTDIGNNYDDANTQPEYYALDNQSTVMAITTLQAEQEVNTFGNWGSDEATDNFRFETETSAEANILTSESSDESTTSYYDNQSNDIGKQSTLVTVTSLSTDKTEPELNNFETDSDGSATDSYISELESLTGSAILIVQPSDESMDINETSNKELTTQKSFGIDDDSNTFYTVSTLTAITRLPMETEKEPLHFNTEISDSPQMESSTSMAGIESNTNHDHVTDHQYNDFNTNTEGSSETITDTYASDNKATSHDIIITTPPSDQLIDSDNIKTSSQEIFEIFTDNYESFQFNTDISDSSEVESSTSRAGIDSNTYPDHKTDRQYIDFNANTEGNSEIVTDAYATENEATFLDIIVTTPPSDQEIFEIFTDSSEPFQFNSEISDSPEVESTTSIVGIESNTYPDQAADSEYNDFNTNTGGISGTSTNTYTPSSDQLNQDSDNVKTSSQQSYEMATGSSNAERENTSDDNFVAVVTISQENISDENNSVPHDGSENITPSSICENQSNNVITTDLTKDNNERTTSDTYETVTQNDVASNTFSSSVILETTSLPGLLFDDNKIQTTVTSNSTIGGTTDHEIIDHDVHQNGSTEGNPDFVLSTEDSNSYIKTSQSTTRTSTPHESDLYTNPNDNIVVEDGSATKVSSTSTVDSIGTTKENKNCNEDASGPCCTDATSTRLPPESDSINSTTDRTTVKNDDQATTAETAELTETPTMLESQNASNQCFLYSPILCPILFLINKIIN